MRLEDVFPYPAFRQGQRELADSVYLACKESKRFVAEAMSGFGKTAAVLAGGICAAEDLDLQIVYACRTKRQVFRVLEELARFAGRVPIRATSLFTKYDYCLSKRRSFGVSPETFKWYCSFQTSNNLCSYFMNVPFNHDNIQKLVDVQTSAPGSISELLRMGMELHVCPYEAARLSLARSRIVVTTYHYLLDASSRSMLIPNEKPLDKVVAIIDEAHNIRDYISGNSTTALSFSDVKSCIDDSRNLFLPRICAAVTQIGDRANRFCSNSSGWLLDKESFVREISGGNSKDWLSDLVFELSTNSGVAWYSVATNRNLPASIIKMGKFLSATLSSLTSEDVELVKSESGLLLVDTNPAKRFAYSTTGLRSLVLLSATINPPDLFLRSIGLDLRSTTVHRALTDYRFTIKTIIDTSVTTRFKMRSAEMYSQIAERITAICSSTPGGVGVFLPSYAVLRSVADVLRSRIEAHRTALIERPELTNDESEQVMSAFKSDRKSLLLAVQGGRFSEGEDFPGDQMDVSVVVGLPLSPPSPAKYAEYRRMESDRFGKHQAYLVLSLLPALRKAFQCAGRHVREPGKVGMVFFLDSRFAQQSTVDLMPPWLREDLVKGEFGPAATAAVTHEFFSAPRGR